jgi:NADPH:quinone reductase-like Zn-dependent oxidoreductase
MSGDRNESCTFAAYGDVDQLQYEDVPTPEPTGNEVLIEVAATSVNPIDWNIRSGAAKDRMPITFPETLGRDVAGTVVKAGTNVNNPKVGQKVTGLVNRTYTEYVTARADHASRP